MTTLFHNPILFRLATELFVSLVVMMLFEVVGILAFGAKNWGFRTRNIVW